MASAILTAGTSEEPRAAPGPGYIAAYGTGSLATGIFSTVPTVLLLYFMTEHLRLPPQWAASILLFAKAWAIVWDPFVGRLTDRAKGNSRGPLAYLAVGAIGMTASFLLLFASPMSLSLGNRAMFAGAAYFSLVAFYSMFAVPYTTIPATLADARLRARLVGWRMTFVMIGILIGAAIAPMLVGSFGGGASGYFGMGLVLALVSGAAMASAILAVRRSAANAPPAVADVAGSILKPFSSPRFLLLAASYVTMLVAAGLLSALTPYVITLSMQRSEGDTGLALGALLVASAITTPLWSIIGRRLGTGITLIGALFLYVAATIFLGVAVRNGGGWAETIVLYGIAGIPFAAMQVLPFTMLASITHEEAARLASGEGAFTGAWLALEKVALAIGPALAGLALAFIGSSRGEAAALTLGIGPPVLGALSVLPLFWLRTRTQ